MLFSYQTQYYIKWLTQVKFANQKIRFQISICLYELLFQQNYNIITISGKIYSYIEFQRMNLCNPSALCITVWRSAHPFQDLFDFILDTQNVIIKQMSLPSNSEIVETHNGPDFHVQGQVKTSRELPSKAYSLQMNSIVENLIRIRKQHSTLQSIWRVLKNNQFYEVKEGDVIKLGLVEFKVKQINLSFKENQRDRAFHDIPTLPTHRQSSSLANSNVSFTSKRSTGKTCRICLDNNADQSDPLISLCRCSGSVQYTHFSCMKAWFDRFIIKQQVRETIFYKCKPAICQLCRQRISEVFQISGKKYSLAQIPKPNCPYFMLETQILDFNDFDDIPQRAKEFQIVKLYKARSLIGNNHLAQVPILDPTISKSHAQFRVIDNKLMMKDRQSRYGSMIKLNDSLKFDSKDGIMLKYQSMVMEIKQGKSIFNWLESSQQYYIEVQNKFFTQKQNSQC